MTDAHTIHSKLRRYWLAAILTATAVGLYLGWKLFWFMTDDAMIAFRYVSNSILGYGYVWNAPPFRAVEGYTSFLWIVLLEWIWRWFGVEPPQIANTVSLVLSYATLLLSVWMVLRLSLHERLERYRLPLLALALLGILTNRTFLAWTSSGLETALFNFCLTLWIFIAVFARRRDALWLFGLTAAAALTHLTRPDGLLIMLSTTFLVAHRLIELRRGGRLGVATIAAAMPMIVPVIHLLWRHSFYGEWLPNTYYAKYVEAWPAAGFRYLASFVLEYGLWFWLAGFAWLAIWWLRREPRGWPSRKAEISSGLRALLPTAHSEHPHRFALLVVLGTIAAHVGYYTLLIGGDHFEYRVYSYLVPLIFISFLWLLNRLVTDGLIAACLLALFIVVSWPIQWTHWLTTKDYVSRDDTWIMKIPIAPEFPSPVRWYAETFDNLQFWLIEHHVCMRHQEHKVFYEFMAARLPARSMIAPPLAGEHPIAAFQSVGVPGWVFPRVAIIDAFGLNDYVIARHKERPRHMRYMAHDRMPPQGYLESFSLNYGLLEDQSAGFIRREYEITTEEIISTEQFWIERIVHGSQQPFSYSMLNRIGESLTRTDRADSALFYLRQAARLDSSQARAYVNLAWVFGKKDLTDSALYYLHRAIAVEPDNPIVVSRLGQALANLAYDRSRVDPVSADTLFAVAQTHLNRALQLDPGQSEAVVEMASIYLFVNRLDSSVAFLERLEALPHPPPEEVRLLGDRYLSRKQRDLAMRAYRLAIRNGLSNIAAGALMHQHEELSDLRVPKTEAH